MYRNMWSVLKSCDKKKDLQIYLIVLCDWDKGVQFGDVILISHSEYGLQTKQLLQVLVTGCLYDKKSCIKGERVGGGVGAISKSWKMGIWWL